MRTLRVPLLVAAVAAGLWAQTPDPPLTNTEIESMLTASLPESTILLKIRVAVFRGLVDLDASSGALSSLKQKGASEMVLNAVVWAEPFGDVLKLRQQAERAAPDLPGSPGVYFKGSSGWIPLASFLLWPPLYSGQAWFRGAHEYSVPLEDGHAALQIGEAQPGFYLRDPASDQAWRIISLASRKDQRLLRLASSGDLGEERVAESQVRDVQIMRVAPDVFVLRPSAQLEAGEYMLCTAVPGGVGSELCYSFGIRR